MVETARFAYDSAFNVVAYLVLALTVLSAIGGLILGSFYSPIRRKVE